MKKRILAVTLALATAISLTNTVFAAEAADDKTEGGINFTGELDTTPIVGLFTAADDFGSDEFTTITEQLKAVVSGDKNAPTVDPAADLSAYGLGADIDFETHELTNVVRKQVFETTKNTSASTVNDVVVIDATNSPSHWYNDTATEGWQLTVSRGEFVDGGNSIVDPMLELLPTSTAGYGVINTDAAAESYTITDEPVLFLNGSLGYVGRQFSSKLTLGEKVPVAGNYKAELTWNLTATSASAKAFEA